VVDNTTLPSPGSGDTIRTLDKGRSDGAKTEVVIVDVGGGDGRSENLLTFPVPVSLADVPQDDDGLPVFSLSPASMDNTETLFRQLMAAARHG